MSMGIREIAKLAGVSPTTVSFVLNNREGVSPETRVRVKQLLAENGYTVKKQARRKSGAALPVCIVQYAAGNLEMPSGMIDRMYAELCRCDLKACVVICYPDNFQHTVMSAVAGKYSAVVIVGTELDQRHARLLDGMDFLGKPVIVLDHAMFCTNVSSVSTACREMSHIALQYLCDLGHREVGYLRSAAALDRYAERLLGFEAAAARFALRAEQQILLSPTIAGAYEDMRRFLADKPRIASALMADSDAIALGAMKALQEGGFRVPEDVSIIGAGNADFGAISNPPLTTIDAATDQVCATAMSHLRKLLNSDGGHEYAEHITVCGRLIPRNSAGPAPAR